MNQLYQHLVTYNPRKKAVTFYRNLTLAEADNDTFSKDAILGLLDAQDPQTEVVLGITFGGKMFQISQAKYSGKYIRESEDSARFISTGAVRVAIGRYLEGKERLVYFRDNMKIPPLEAETVDEPDDDLLEYVRQPDKKHHRKQYYRKPTTKKNEK